MPELISITEAQRLVLERAKRLDAERVPVERAAGRVLAEPAAATVDLPPFASSAMDGYALRSADTQAAPVTLPVVARVAAGQPAAAALGPGEAMAIATGGAVPEGADAVVPLELVEESDSGSLSASRCGRARTSAREAATSAPGKRRCRRGRGSGPRQVGRSRRRG